MRPYAQADLTENNSLRLRSKVEEFVVLRHISDVEQAFKFDGPLSVLGAGSNVILMSKIEGRLVKIAIKGKSISKIGDDQYELRIGAGENWNEIVRYTLGKGIAGLENLVLIPGSAGAAPYQNIGAYGSELSDRLVKVKVYDRHERSIRQLCNQECGFGYRDSVFKRNGWNRYIILELTLLLGKGGLNTSYEDVAARVKQMHSSMLSASRIAETVSSIRKFKLPDLQRYPNVGSVFKNPIISQSHACQLQAQFNLPVYSGENGCKVSAAYLIDTAGWKGKEISGIWVWPRQPLVLVHKSGKSSAADFLSVAAEIRDDVKAKFGVELEIEPVIVGASAKN